MYFYQARYYNPVLGRFISPDSIVPGAGNPQSLNRYSYVLNNPTTLVDPSGHSWLSSFLHSFAGVAAGILVGVALGDMGVSPLLAGLAGGAAAGATNAVLNGGDLGANLFFGAALGGLSAGLGPPLAAALGGGPTGAVGSAALLGAAFGGIGAGIAGKNILAGMLGGALSGAVLAMAIHSYQAWQQQGSSAVEEAGGPPSSGRPTTKLQRLPAGDGYYSYSPGERQFGSASTLDVISDAGTTWHSLHPDVAFGVGDISLEAGGPISGHSGHQLGLEFDIRPLRTDGVNGPVDYRSPVYSRALTQDLVNIFLSDPQVTVILFNDPQVQGVSPYPRHNNHLHIRVRP